MARRIDIRDEIIYAYEYKNLDLRFLTGFAVDHDFFEDGTIKASCNECGLVTVEFASEEKTISFSLYAIFRGDHSFNFDRKKLRKRYKAHLRYRLAHPQKTKR